MKKIELKTNQTEMERPTIYLEEIVSVTESLEQNLNLYLDGKRTQQEHNNVVKNYVTHLDRVFDQLKKHYAHN